MKSGVGIEVVICAVFVACFWIVTAGADWWQTRQNLRAERMEDGL